MDGAGAGARAVAAAAATPDERLPLGRHLAPLLPVLLLLGWVWAPLLALPLTGEDYSLFSHALRGEPVYPHVFRPWSGFLIASLHALFGVESPAPYHAVSLGLHALNAVLVYALGLALLRSRALAGLAALLFAVGAGVTDSLAWIAALNRPLSGLGALLALNGLVRLGPRPRAAPALVLGGLALQFGANEEFYGTALLVLVWCLPCARCPEVRRPALALAALALAAVALHQLVFQRVPGGSERLLAGGAGPVLTAALASAARRVHGLAAGWGISRELPFLPFVLAGLMALAVGPRCALFALLAWAASLLPFALSDAVPYRAYPTQAPTALLLAGAAAELVPGRSDRRRAPLEAGTALLLGGLALLASHAPRAARLERWTAALREVEACRPAALELARLDPSRPPALVNLDTTTAALFAYHFRRDPTELVRVGFLDAATGCVPPRLNPPEPWFGRRCEGSYGPIEPRTYLSARPALEPLGLYERVVPVSTLGEARRRLADGSVDVAREVLAEAPAELFADVGRGAGAPGSVELLEPLVFDPGAREAAMRVRVRTPRSAVLAYLDDVLYRDELRISLDQTIFSDVRETRVIELEARVAATGELRPTFRLDAYGLGVLVAPGDHELALRFTVTGPAELR